MANSPRDTHPDPTLEKIRSVLELIRPAVQGDGGDVQLESFEDGVVVVRFSGACIGCPSKSITMTHGLEKTLREHVPEVRAVRAAN